MAKLNVVIIDAEAFIVCMVLHLALSIVSGSIPIKLFGNPQIWVAKEPDAYSTELIAS